MSFREKVPEIRALAEHFLQLSEHDADTLLQSAGANGVTPAGWGRADGMSRRSQIVLLLTRQSDDTLDRLMLVTDADAPAGPAPSAPAPEEASTALPPSTNEGPLFLVHGHDHAKLHEAVRVLERITGRDVIVLHEQPNAGQTLLEKLERHALDAAYAVVLLTADDEGGAIGASERRPRGRQNVILELGFFFGTLGRRRVAVLLEPNVEKPSDIEGLVYISLDAAGAWKQSLARELRSASIEIDMTRMP